MVGELVAVYLATGFYIKVEIKRDPGRLLSTIEWLLWLLGVEAAGCEM